MTDKRAKVPGPDHPITIERNPARVFVAVAGRIVADTCDAVTLREASYAAVQYVPQKDVDMSALERSAHATLPVQGRLCLLRHLDRRSAIEQCCVDVRGALSCRRRDPRTPRLLSRTR